VRLERLLKVPRAARTIHLVINIPEPATPPVVVPTPPKPTAWARIWAVLKIAGPASVATAAIIIALLSLHEQDSANRDQQLANKAAEGSIERHDAEQVSFLQDFNSQSPPFGTLTVQNRGATPIYAVTFQVEIGTDNSANKFVTKTFVTWLGTVPACSSGTVNIASAAVNLMKEVPSLKKVQIRANGIGIVADSMGFIDSNGLGWQYSSAGFLQQSQAAPELPSSFDGYLEGNYKPIAGCT
jgi:hypothetical protein